MNKLSLKEFEKTQMVNLKNIECNICKEKNKYNTFNNEFYKCYECNINICPLCKLKHNNEHNIINYDKIHYICNKHDGEKFINYCNKCKINVCSLFDKEHSEHKKQSIIDMIFDKKDLLIKLDELKRTIDIFNDNINKIIEVLNNVKENMDDYYKLEEYIINNYNQKERNYEILYNIDKIVNYNNIIINDINQINNQHNINYIYNIYNKINNNEIKLTLKIKECDINKEIYFLDNTNGQVYVRLEVNQESEKGLDEIQEEHHHDFLKELNELNTELYINNKKYKYEKYFIPEKEGEYNILLKFNILMTDCSFMFYNCDRITNIDLSSFNTKNVIKMLSMFEGCSNLTSINLSSLNTQNVMEMTAMFNKCSNLTNIDLSSFDTQNVTNMAGMFAQCSKITNIDLSSFNTKKVINMFAMFNGCYSLTNVDLSSFNTKNVSNMAGFLAQCSNLTNVDLSSFDTQNVNNMFCMFDLCYKLKEIKINKNHGEKIKNEIKNEGIIINYI